MTSTALLQCALMSMLIVFAELEPSCKDNPHHYNFSLSVEILNNDLAHTSVTVSVRSSRCSKPNTTHIVHLESSAHYNVSTCQRADDTVRHSSDRDQKLEFNCGDLELNRVFNVTLLAVVGGKPIYLQKHKLYTTDVQAVTAEPAGTTETRVTCHFAQGTSCRGCLIRVQWSDTDATQSVTFSQELVVKRLSGSLTASGTIEHLLPGRLYTAVAYDMEEDGNVSTIGVPLDSQPLTTRADDEKGAEDNRFSIGASAAVVALLIVICALIIAILMRRRCKDSLSSKDIIYGRRPPKKSKEKTKKEEADLELNDPPPVPPRTPNMFISVRSTSTNSTNSTTIDDTITADSIFDDSSSTPGTSQRITFSPPSLDTISCSSDSPPIPPRTAAMLVPSPEQPSRVRLEEDQSDEYFEMLPQHPALRRAEEPIRMNTNVAYLDLVHVPPRNIVRIQHKAEIHPYHL